MEKKFWNEAAENMSRDELSDLQWKKLTKQMHYIYNSSSYFKQQFDDIGTHPNDIRNIEEFRELPIFMDKQSDRETQETSREKLGHPFGEYLCASPRDVRAIHSTSGTTGVPVFEAFTKHDIFVQNEVVARTFWRAGLRSGDYVLHVPGLSMWLAGMVPMRAYEYMGLAGIPVGADSGVSRVLDIAKLVKAKGMFCIPSFAEYIIRKTPEIASLAASDLGIQIVIAVGEPGAGIPETRKRLKEGFGAKIFDSTGGIWGFAAISCDSEDYQGMHLVCEDYHYLDIVDPATKKPVDMSAGSGIGEMVHTALEWEAGPAFRYALGDVIELMTQPCTCGMPGMRMKYKGRIDDLLIVKGVNVFPAAVKGVVDSFIPKVTGEMRIVLTTPPPRVDPPLRMKLEYGHGVGKQELQTLGQAIANEISARLRIRPAIEMVPPDTLEKDPSKKAKLIEKNF
ncbi:MAG: phenylacetate--CoA ligase family protein [Planctomycetota bacterium]|jgi:phenylacetate-CoA ligase